MHQFPGPHFLPGLIEEALVVYFAHFLASFPVQPLPQRAILVVDPEILLLVGRRHFVGSEEETVRIAIDQFGSYLGRFGTRDNVLGHLVPRDIEVHMTEIGIAKDLRNVRGMILFFHFLWNCLSLALGIVWGVKRLSVRNGWRLCLLGSLNLPLQLLHFLVQLLELVLELLQVWRLCVLRLCLRPNCAKSERHQGQACDSYPLVQTERFHSVSATYRARYQMPRQTKTVTFVSENSAACSVSIRM